MEYRLPLNDPTIDEVLDALFTYHPPKGDQFGKHDAINAACREACRVILKECPQCTDRTAAIRYLREAHMTANSSIATKSGGLIDL